MIRSKHFLFSLILLVLSLPVIFLFQNCSRSSDFKNNSSFATASSYSPLNQDDCKVIVSSHQGSCKPSYALVIPNNTTTTEQYYSTNFASATKSGKCEASTISCKNGKLSSAEEVFRICWDGDSGPVDDCPAPINRDCTVIVSPLYGSEAPTRLLTIPNNTTTKEEYFSTDRSSGSPSGKCESSTITCRNGQLSSAEEVFSGCLVEPVCTIMDSCGAPPADVRD